MELQIIKDRTNPILKRREISLIIKNDHTPSRGEVKNKLSAKIDSKPELIVVERLDNEFGKQETLGRVSVYQDEERLKQLAHQYLLEREKPPVSEEGDEAQAAEAGETEAGPEDKTQSNETT